VTGPVVVDHAALMPGAEVAVARVERIKRRAVEAVDVERAAEVAVPEVVAPAAVVHAG
jgi:hypothetical protein